MKVHVDTDFAGDTDDAAAVAMVLGWPGAELVGATTVADPDGRRAGYLAHLLRMAGRGSVPVAAGAGASLTTGGPMGDLPDHGTYWGEAAVAPAPRSEGATVALLAASVEAGATVVAIGPSTNLALLEAERPGLLATARVVVMGGWVVPPRAGLPPWGPDMDWNVQCDTDAARTVLGAAGDLTLVTLPATLAAHLRRRDLDRLRASGPIGRLLARQALAHAAEHDTAGLARAHGGLPDDLLNFQYDPVACAVALGGPVAQVAPMRLRPRLDGDVLGFEVADDGREVDVVVEVDGAAFDECWITSIERADRRAAGGA